MHRDEIVRAIRSLNYSDATASTYFMIMHAIADTIRTTTLPESLPRMDCLGYVKSYERLAIHLELAVTAYQQNRNLQIEST